jgi:hypothetical protein
MASHGPFPAAVIVPQGGATKETRQDLVSKSPPRFTIQHYVIGIALSQFRR